MTFSVVFANSVPAQALTSDEVNQLSYLQVKGTGLANRCYDVKGEDSIKLSSGMKLSGMCIEPLIFKVEGLEPDKTGVTKSKYINAKLMTRQTYTLTEIDGDIDIKNGNFEFKEQDGIDYAATTVQLPGGDRVPFLFTIKELIAEGKGDTFKPGFEFGGKFKVPSYRTGLFLDPKGRGATTGYDMAVALPGRQNGDDEDSLQKENNKVFDVYPGSIEFEVKTVNQSSGEIGGIFVQTQPSDTDMGSKTPKNLLIKGKFYAKVE